MTAPCVIEVAAALKTEHQVSAQNTIRLKKKKINGIKLGDRGDLFLQSIDRGAWPQARSDEFNLLQSHYIVKLLSYLLKGEQNECNLLLHIW